MSNSKLPFRLWLEAKYSSPELLLSDYQDELEKTANIIGGSLPNDISEFKLDGTTIYIPNINGVSDGKQYAKSDLVMSGDTKIPTVTFCSYRASMGNKNFSPMKQLWNEYHAYRNGNDFIKPPSSAYSNAISKCDDEKIKKINTTASNREHGFKLAELASSKCLENCRHGNFNYLIEKKINDGGFIANSTIKMKLFHQQKNNFNDNAIVCIKGDLIIPLTNIETNKLQNIQRVYKENSTGKYVKRFLHGAKLKSSVYISSKLSLKDATAFILVEGYATTKTISKYTDNLDVIVISCLSANQIPNIKRYLEVAFPTTLILSGADDDNDGLLYTSNADLSNYHLVPDRGNYPYTGTDWTDFELTWGEQVTGESIIKQMNVFAKRNTT